MARPSRREDWKTMKGFTMQQRHQLRNRTGASDGCCKYRNASEESCSQGKMCAEEGGDSGAKNNKYFRRRQGRQAGRQAVNWEVEVVQCSCYARRSEDKVTFPIESFQSHMRLPNTDSDSDTPPHFRDKRHLIQYKRRAVATQHR